MILLILLLELLIVRVHTLTFPHVLVVVVVWVRAAVLLTKRCPGLVSDIVQL